MDSINWTEIVIALLGALGLPLLGLLGVALNRWGDMLAAKTKLAFIAEIDDYITELVLSAWSVTLKALKAGVRDGALSREDYAAAAMAAKNDIVNAVFDRFGRGSVNKALGGHAVKATKAKIERAVTVAKNIGKAARLPLA